MPFAPRLLNLPRAPVWLQCSKAKLALLAAELPGSGTSSARRAADLQESAARLAMFLYLMLAPAFFLTAFPY